MLYSKDAPSSARNGPRKSSVQECTPSLSENALRRCFAQGLSAAQANERWLLRCSAHVGLPLRCRGALGDAVLRSFGCWMSSLMRMAAERAEHEQVQVRVRARARMPLLPPVLRALSNAVVAAFRRCGRWRQRCVSRGSGTVHRKTERDGVMGLPSALYCDKVATMIFSEEHIAHSSATALAKPNADIAVVLGSCAVMSQHLAQKCMSACAVMSEHLAQGCFGLAAVASQHWAQRSHCVAEFASITYRY